MCEKVMGYDGDLTVKEGEYLPLSEEDVRGYVDQKMVEMIRGEVSQSFSCAGL